MKLSKTQLHKIVQSGAFLGRRIWPLLKTGLRLIGNVIKPLAKSVLIPFGLIGTESATDTAIHKKMFGSSFTTLIISNEEMNNNMIIVKSFEESGNRRSYSLFIKKIFGSDFTTLINSNEEIHDIMIIVKHLEESRLLIKGVNERIKNEAKEQKEGILGMLLVTLGASLLGNLLTGKGTIRASKGTITAVENFFVTS